MMSTLKTFDEYNRQRINSIKRLKELEIILDNFNPDTHSIVTKGQLDLTNQLKALTALNGIANTVQEVHNKLNDLKPLKEDIQFIKGIYTTPTPEKKKTTISKEERSIARIAKLLKTPQRKG